MVASLPPPVGLAPDCAIEALPYPGGGCAVPLMTAPRRWAGGIVRRCRLSTFGPLGLCKTRPPSTLTSQHHPGLVLPCVSSSVRPLLMGPVAAWDAVCQHRPCDARRSPSRESSGLFDRVAHKLQSDHINVAIALGSSTAGNQPEGAVNKRYGSEELQPWFTDQLDLDAHWLNKGIDMRTDSDSFFYR